MQDLWTAPLRVLIPAVAIFVFVFILFRLPNRSLGRTFPGAAITILLLVAAVIGNSFYWYAQDLLAHSKYQAGLVTVGVILFSLYIVVLSLLIGFAFNVAVTKEPRRSKESAVSNRPKALG